MNKKQTVERLKQIRITDDIVGNLGHPLLEEALEHFRLKAPDCDKFACVHNPDAQIVVVDFWVDRWKPGERRFECKSNNVQSCVTYKLTKSTSHKQLSDACRNAYEEDLPGWLRSQRRPGIELDHTNINHCEIVREFKSEHPDVEPYKVGERWVLPDDAKLTYQKLHRERTNDFRGMVARPILEHRDLTRSRARDSHQPTVTVDPARS